ncbi:hypothetical protein [Streptomyces broussonetiae]|uniref:hypothetical protein n=1 Tax=Streptomyces broussonetiae TaxID=2686304 RepID=UPI0035DA9033
MELPGGGEVVMTLEGSAAFVPAHGPAAVRVRESLCGAGLTAGAGPRTMCLSWRTHRRQVAEAVGTLESGVRAVEPGLTPWCG